MVEVKSGGLVNEDSPSPVEVHSIIQVKKEGPKTYSEGPFTDLLFYVPNRLFCYKTPILHLSRKKGFFHYRILVLIIGKRKG